MFGKRLFTLGCSYTSYNYPTWADWLSTEFLEFENLGIAGLGNRAIFNRLSELVYTRKLDRADTVVIAWSTPIREDRYYTSKGGWLGAGNIYNNRYYTESWVQEFFDPFMGLMETINYIHAALHMLQNVGCKYAFTFMMFPYSIDPVIETNNAKEFTELCDPEMKLWPYLKHVLDHPNILKTDIHGFTKHYELQNDLPIVKKNYRTIALHPNPLSMYFYTKDILCPHLGFTNFDNSQKNEFLARKWSDYVCNIPRKKHERQAEPRYPRHGKSLYVGF